MSIYARFVKRPLDILFALLLLPLLLLALLTFGLAIFLDDHGPVLYVAQRIGRNGKLYPMYKFRTMIVNAPDIRLSDGSTFNAHDDKRLTRLGGFLRRTSIDELPQVLNILKGDMSLIGPRPDPPDWMERYPVELLSFLHVRPGITGYTQAYFRNSVDSYQKIVYDAHYADHVSFPLDAKIFLKTIGTVLLGKGLYRVPDEKDPAP